MNRRPILALPLIAVFVVSMVLPVLPASAINLSTTLNNGRATWVVNSNGFISSEGAYLNSNPPNGDIYLWYYGANFTYEGTNHVYADASPQHFTTVVQWKTAANMQSAWSVACAGVSCELGVVQKIVAVPDTTALVWGLRFVNTSPDPITNLKFYGYQDADFYHGDEGHFVPYSSGILKFVAYENGGNTALERASGPYYGYTFGGVATGLVPSAHDLNPSYSGGYADVTNNHMNGANYYFSDGANIARYTIGSLAPGASVTIYWILGISPGPSGQNGLQAQLLLGTLLDLLATPPAYCFC